MRRVLTSEKIRTYGVRVAQGEASTRSCSMDSVPKAGLLKLFVLAGFQSAAAVVQGGGGEVCVCGGGGKNVELFMEKVQIRRANASSAQKNGGKHYKVACDDVKNTQTEDAQRVWVHLSALFFFF